MFATTFEYNYKLNMWGADGTVDMQVSKTCAARRKGATPLLPTKNILEQNLGRTFGKVYLFSCLIFYCPLMIKSY